MALRRATHPTDCLARRALCNTADYAHHSVLVVQHPKIEFGFDTAAQHQSFAKRQSVLNAL
jgi:hypothetical protein